jgi:hypothetical protein
LSRRETILFGCCRPKGFVEHLRQANVFRGKLDATRVVFKFQQNFIMIDVYPIRWQHIGMKIFIAWGNLYICATVSKSILGQPLFAWHVKSLLAVQSRVPLDGQKVCLPSCEPPTAWNVRIETIAKAWKAKAGRLETERQERWCSW